MCYSFYKMHKSCAFENHNKKRTFVTQIVDYGKRRDGVTHRKSF